ncbi:hypothetical protein Scep_026699 [Stephania cephalantha]|uniref:phosphatidylglycerophosphatase n=1 Tax=Stephania cephalantha TaxID=152367 RepID=A0AAP0EKN3_9MAGN
MHIGELKEGESEIGGEGLVADLGKNEILVSEAKRVLVGAGARVLFYPTLLYNVVRNKVQAEFRWWDEVNEFLLLGAVPFPTDVPRLEQLGVRGVVTLNEPYETLVPTSLYHAHGIDHLVIPTRDYLFAPSYGDICQAVDFIHRNTSNGSRTYVHCKAGRGRSTTIVLCYLIQHNQMTPDAAYSYVRSIRSRVLLAPAQWQAVQTFYNIRVKSTRGLKQLVLQPCSVFESNAERVVESLNTNSVAMISESYSNHFVVESPVSPTSIQDMAAFDESSVVVVTESDLDGYDGSSDSGIVGNELCTAEVSLVYKVQFAGQAALARLTRLRLRCYTREKMSSGEKSSRATTTSTTNSCSVGANKLPRVGIDIRVC